MGINKSKACDTSVGKERTSSQSTLRSRKRSSTTTSLFDGSAKNDTTCKPVINPFSYRSRKERLIDSLRSQFDTNKDAENKDDISPETSQIEAKPVESVQEDLDASKGYYSGRITSPIEALHEEIKARQLPKLLDDKQDSTIENSETNSVSSSLKGQLVAKTSDMDNQIRNGVAKREEDIIDELIRPRILDQSDAFMVSNTENTIENPKIKRNPPDPPPYDFTDVPYTDDEATTGTNRKKANKMRFSNCIPNSAGDRSKQETKPDKTKDSMSEKLGCLNNNVPFSDSLHIFKLENCNCDFKKLKDRELYCNRSGDGQFRRQENTCCDVWNKRSGWDDRMCRADRRHKRVPYPTGRDDRAVHSPDRDIQRASRWRNKYPSNKGPSKPEMSSNRSLQLIKGKPLSGHITKSTQWQDIDLLDKSSTSVLGLKQRINSKHLRLERSASMQNLTESRSCHMCHGRNANGDMHFCCMHMQLMAGASQDSEVRGERSYARRGCDSGMMDSKSNTCREYRSSDRELCECSSPHHLSTEVNYSLSASRSRELSLLTPTESSSSNRSRNRNRRTCGTKNKDIYRQMEELGLGFIRDGEWVPTDFITKTLWNNLQKCTDNCQAKWKRRSRSFTHRKTMEE